MFYIFAFKFDEVQQICGKMIFIFGFLSVSIPPSRRYEIVCTSYRVLVCLMLNYVRYCTKFPFGGVKGDSSMVFVEDGGKC